MRDVRAIRSGPLCQNAVLLEVVQGLPLFPKQRDQDTVEVPSRLCLRLERGETQSPLPQAAFLIWTTRSLRFRLPPHREFQAQAGGVGDN